MTIGIPRSLYAHYYEPLWRTFFNEAGFDVKLSLPTNKKIIDDGVIRSVDEICIPMKIFIGHALSLIKEGVDYIFIPLMGRIKPSETYCPKFLGLPDMSNALLHEYTEKILIAELYGDTEDDAYYKLFRELAIKLNLPKKTIKKASKIAIDSWHKYRGKLVTPELDKEHIDFYSNTLSIGLIGYPYILHDTYLNQNIFNYLKRLGIRVLTFENFTDMELENAITHYDKKTFWTFTNMQLGAANIWCRDSSVDGIIHLTAFACGIDAMLGQYLDELVHNTKMPFATIRLDELSGEAHIHTRLEAFIDLLINKKANTTNLKRKMANTLKGER